MQEAAKPQALCAANSNAKAVDDALSPVEREREHMAQSLRARPRPTRSKLFAPGTACAVVGKTVAGHISRHNPELTRIIP